jgi:hypothetical protein
VRVIFKSEALGDVVIDCGHTVPSGAKGLYRTIPEVVDRIVSPLRRRVGVSA